MGERMENLILLTNGYPYGNWEPYLETEVKYYPHYFKKIFICSLQVRKEHRDKVRNLPKGEFEVCRIDYASRWIYLINAIRAISDFNLYREIFNLIKKKKLIWGRFVRLVVYITRAHYEAKQILDFINKYEIKEGLIYSYRFEYQPYVGCIIQKKHPYLKIITRAHGSDLFEDRKPYGYIPMREYVLQHVNKVYLIADDGMYYLKSRYPEYKAKLTVSRLGTSDYGFANISKSPKMISVVSCSAIVPIKRIDLIIKALSEIDDIEVYWTHFGEGVLLEEMKLQCETMPKNIHYDFRGFVSNQQVLKEYGEGRYHLFLNTSKSEGVPVSIMEAISFGIPCIATNVGGTGEIIIDKLNGILLDDNFDIIKLSEWIRNFSVMEVEEYNRYRVNARTTWEIKYSATNNYNTFCNEITEL